MPEPHESVEQPESLTSNQPAEEVEGGAQERPIENLAAEVNRKFGKLAQGQNEMNQRMDALLTYMTQAQQAQARPAATGDDSDEDLWEKAKQGDRTAFEEYQRRIARREFTQQNTVNTRQQATVTQLQVLGQRYPVFNDPSHPLTQTAQAAYQLLVRSGYPAGQETLLEAAKTAIADRPDLVSALYNQNANVNEGVRRNSSQAAYSGQMGGTVRNEPAPRAGQPRPLSAEQIRLAKIMGVKDPAGARDRFLKRREQGISNVGAVGGMLNEEDL